MAMERNPKIEEGLGRATCRRVGARPEYDLGQYIELYSIV